MTMSATPTRYSPIALCNATHAAPCRAERMLAGRIPAWRAEHHVFFLLLSVRESLAKAQISRIRGTFGGMWMPEPGTTFVIPAV